MTGLDNMINKIISDGEKEAENIINEAKEEKDRKVKNAYKESKKFLAENKRHSENKGKQLKELFIVEENIKHRDNVLGKKQGILDRLFIDAEEKLKEISMDEYENFIKRYLLQMELTGNETIFIPNKYKELNTKSLNDFVFNSNKKVNLEFVFEDSIESGFIVKQEGIENNFTFKTLLNYYRNELELDLIKIFE